MIFEDLGEKNEKLEMKRQVFSFFFTLCAQIIYFSLFSKYTLEKIT